MPAITKSKSTKIKSKTSTKSYQIRLTITAKIQEDIIKARKKYKYLDDVEIIKIFIGRGADMEIYENNLKPKTLKEAMQGASFIDIEDEEEQFDFLRKNGIMKS